MSAIEMIPLTSKFSYQRLRKDNKFDDEEEDEGERVIVRKRSWSRLGKVGCKNRPRIRIPGLRRFLRRKAKLFSAVKVSCWNRFLKRFKDSRAHFNELFAGNYLFMQVNPSLKSFEKSFLSHDLHGFSARYSLGRIA